MRNIINDKKYLTQRKELENSIKPEFKISNETKNIITPCKKYSLVIEFFSHTEESCHLGGLKCHFGASKCSIFNFKNDKIIELKRNHDSFPYLIISDSKETKYLLYGKDYQGYSIFDFKSKQIKDYVPESAYKGMGFCWVEFHYNHKKNILAVESCYWGCPYEIVFYDFSKPLDLPYKEISRIKDYENVIGWISDTEFNYTNEQNDLKSILF